MSFESFLLSQGATDSEKRVQHLTLENKALKQSLSLTRDLLLHWGPAPPNRAPQVSCSLAATEPAARGSCTLVSSNTAWASSGLCAHWSRGREPPLTLQT